LGLPSGFCPLQKQAARPAAIISKNTALPRCAHSAMAPASIRPTTAVPSQRAGRNRVGRVETAESGVIGRPSREVLRLHLQSDRRNCAMPQAAAGGAARGGRIRPRSSSRRNSENDSEFSEFGASGRFPRPICAAIPGRFAQIPCPPEHGNALAKTAKSFAENSESAELEQGYREFRLRSARTERCAGRRCQPCLASGARGRPPRSSPFCRRQRVSTLVVVATRRRLPGCYNAATRNAAPNMRKPQAGVATAGTIWHKARDFADSELKYR
jgi:hypothetical protein